MLWAEAERPTVVLTNIGVAVARDDSDGYEYVCPSLWDEVTTPLTASVGPGEHFVVGTLDVYYTRDIRCGVDGAGLVGWVDPVTIQGITVNGERGAVVAGATREQGTLLWGLLNAAETLQIFETNQRLDGVLSHGDAFIATSARPTLTIYAAAQEVTTKTPVAPTDGVQRLTPRLSIDGRLYFSAVTNDGVALWRSDDDGETLTELATGELSLHGPVQWCDGVVAVVDGALVVDADHPPRCPLAPFAGQRFQCLTESNGFVYVCQDRALHALRENEIVEVWTLDRFEGPRCLADRCEQNWFHYGAESGLLEDEVPDAGSPDASVGVTPDTSIAPPAEPSTGDCSCQTTRPEAPGWFRRR